MATSLETTIRFSIDATLDGGAALGSLTATLPFVKSRAWANATADTIYFAEHTVAGSATDTHDFTAMAQPTPLGTDAVAFSYIRAILINNQATATTRTLRVTATTGFTGPFNAAGDEVDIDPGSFQYFENPGVDASANWAVAGTGGITVQNTAILPVTYDLIVIGKA